MYEIGTVDPGGRTRRFHHFKFSGSEIGSTQRSKNAYLPGLPLYGYKISADKNAPTVDSYKIYIALNRRNKLCKSEVLVALNDNEQKDNNVEFDHFAAAA